MPRRILRRGARRRTTYASGGSRRTSSYSYRVGSKRRRTSFRSGNRGRTRRSSGRITRAGPYRHRSGYPRAGRSRHGFVVSHEEYIGDITAPADNGDVKTGNPVPFAVNAYGINPGDAGTFPWLATLANSFEEYSWSYLTFCYKTVSSDAVVASGATMSLGVVVMATEYNSNNPPFTSRQQMELYEGSMSVKPSLSACHYVECRRNLTPYQTLYVRANQHFVNDPILGPLQNYDIGQFQVSTCNVKPGVCGELWARYRVILKKPKLSLINQPFLSAMDLGIPLNTPIPPGTSGVAYNSDYFVSTGPMVFPDRPNLALQTQQCNNQRSVGVYLVSGDAATGATGYWRFPDEAPVGTIIMFAESATVAAPVMGDGYTRAYQEPTVNLSFPPAPNTMTACECIMYHSNQMNGTGVLPSLNFNMIITAFRRTSNTIPWSWAPGFTANTVAASVTCSNKYLMFTYLANGLPTGVTGVPIGPARW